jgi:hypothetical protein
VRNRKVTFSLLPERKTRSRGKAAFSCPAERKTVSGGRVAFFMSLREEDCVRRKSSLFKIP